MVMCLGNRRQVTADGTVNYPLPKVVEDIQVNFATRKVKRQTSRRTDQRRTREFIITRELELKPGRVFNRNTVQKTCSGLRTGLV